MAYISPYMFMLKPKFIPLIACRIVDISIKHGVCSETAFGLASYSYCHVTVLRGEVDTAYQWCKMALSLHEGLSSRIGCPHHSKILIPKLKILCYHSELFCVKFHVWQHLSNSVILLVFPVLFYWKEPIQSTSDILLHCYKEALMVGDNEYASFGANFYCAQNILCGKSLPLVEKECTILASKMVTGMQFPSIG